LSQPPEESDEPRHEPDRDARDEPEGDQAAPSVATRTSFLSRIGLKRTALVAWGISFFERRKKHSGEPLDEGMDEPSSEPSAIRAPTDKAHDDSPLDSAIDPTEPSAPPKHGRRRFLILVALLLLTTVAGAGFSYILLGHLLDQQDEKLRGQQARITALELADKKKGAQTADLTSKLSDEQLKRTAAETRNASLEAKVAELGGQPQSAAPPSMTGSPAPKVINRGAQADSMRPSQSSTFRPSGRTAESDCELKPGSYGENLKNCIEAFNRNQ
jgi:hypothetical protein